MHETSRLLARLLPFVVTAAACGPVSPVASSSGATGAPTAPARTAATTTVATTAATATAAKEKGGSLDRCGPCSPHCYEDTSGGECLPYEAGAALDARLGCHFEGAFGRHREGNKCCYGGVCPGRPLVVASAARVASLRLGTAWGS